MAERFIQHQVSPADCTTFVEFLWTSYSEEVFLRAYAKLGNLEDARDVCQETILKALQWIREKADQKPDRINYPAWLQRIASRLVIDRWRRQKLQGSSRSRMPESDEEAHILQDWPDDRVEETANQMAKCEEITALRHCIEELPERQRLVVTLRDLQGLSYEQISAAAGISVSLVGVTLHRARKALRDCVELKLYS